MKSNIQKVSKMSLEMVKYVKLSKMIRLGQNYSKFQVILPHPFDQIKVIRVTPCFCGSYGRIDRHLFIIQRVLVCCLRLDSTILIATPCWNPFRI